MDRRNFLAMSSVAAVAGTGAMTGGAKAEGTTAQGATSQAGAKPARGAAPAKLLLRKIPSSGEQIPAVGLGTSGPFEVGDSERGRRAKGGCGREDLVQG